MITNVKKNPMTHTSMEHRPRSKLRMSPIVAAVASTMMAETAATQTSREVSLEKIIWTAKPTHRNWRSRGMDVSLDNAPAFRPPKLPAFSGLDRADVAMLLPANAGSSVYMEERTTTMDDRLVSKKGIQSQQPENMWILRTFLAWDEKRNEKVHHEANELRPSWPGDAIVPEECLQH